MKSEISELKNLGKACETWLNDVGVFTQQQLRELGPVQAWVLVRASGRPATMNFVYAVQAALMDIHWTNLPQDIKDELKNRCETLKK